MSTRNNSFCFRKETIGTVCSVGGLELCFSFILIYMKFKKKKSYPSFRFLSLWYSLQNREGDRSSTWTEIYMLCSNWDCWLCAFCDWRWKIKKKGCREFCSFCDAIRSARLQVFMMTEFLSNGKQYADVVVGSVNAEWFPFIRFVSLEKYLLYFLLLLSV